MACYRYGLRLYQWPAPPARIASACRQPAHSGGRRLALANGEAKNQCRTGGSDAAAPLCAADVVRGWVYGFVLLRFVDER